MSKFSGKCDFYDIIEMYGLDRILAARVCIANTDEELQLNCRADCIKYYPHIVMYSSCNNEGNDCFCLSEKSWVDMEEERYGLHPYYDTYRELLKKEIEKYEKTE